MPMHLPLRSTVQRSATALISFSLCVMNRMLLPSLTSSFIIFISSSISCGVKTAVGSSKIKISFSRYSIFKISTRCCMPTLISEIRASGSTRKPYRSDRAITFSRALSIFKKPPCVLSTPRMMFSSTVKLCTSLKCWCTMPMPRRLASFGSFSCTTSPFFLITPFSGWYMPNSTLINVDFPAPFSPKSAWISPFLSCNVTSSFAMMPGNSLVMPHISMM